MSHAFLHPVAVRISQNEFRLMLSCLLIGNFACALVPSRSFAGCFHQSTFFSIELLKNSSI